MGCGSTFFSFIIEVSSLRDNLLASQFERFTIKVKKLNFVYDNRTYYANPTE